MTQVENDRGYNNVKSINNNLKINKYKISPVSRHFSKHTFL